MTGLAAKLDGATVIQEIAVVTAAAEGPGAELMVRAASGAWRAKRAFGCLVAPEVDDRVLLATSPAGESFILSVLERPGDAPRRLAVDGDLRVQAEGGSLSMTATESVELGSGETLRLLSRALELHAREGNVFIETLQFASRVANVDAERVKSFVGLLDQVADRITQKVKSSYRFVEDLDVTRSGQIDMRAEQNVHLRGRNTLLSAEQLAKVDAEQIHLGLKGAIMFANTQMMGMDLGFPDVCLTPTPAGPVPIPYPNIGMGPTAIPSQVKVFNMFTPAHNMATTIPLTNGDNAGLATGVASGTVMGPDRHVVNSFTTLVGGMPASRMTSVAIQNNTNCPGVRLVPSQVRVLILAP